MQLGLIRQSSEGFTHRRSELYPACCQSVELNCESLCSLKRGAIVRDQDLLDLPDFIILDALEQVRVQVEHGCLAAAN